VVLRKVDGSPAKILGRGYPLDLSPDGRWVLTQSDDLTTLTILPTGAGQSRGVDVHGLTIRNARWLPDGRGIVVLGWMPADNASHLYILEDDKVRALSDLDLSARRTLTISPDGRWAAVVNPDYRTVVVSLEDGKARPLPPGLVDTLPRAWSSEGHLWI